MKKMAPPVGRTSPPQPPSPWKSRARFQAGEGGEQRVQRSVTMWMVVFAMTITPALAQVTLDWPGGTMVLGADATLDSLVEASAGRECARPVGTPIALVHVAGQGHDANAIEATAEGFLVRFAGVDTVVEYAAEPADDWLLLRIAAISGTRPDLVGLRLPVAVNERVGRTLNIGWDDQTAVCMMAGNMQTFCRANGQNDLFLTATTQDAPGPRLEGAAVALIACPTARFKAIAREVSHACDLPTNEDADDTPVKDTDLVRGSYWFIQVGPSNLDDVIDYCHRAGIGQVMMNSGSWCKDVGHYTFKEGLTNGREDLKAMVDEFHANGILVGMHCFVSKVSKTDAYVTPVPDRRFWVDRRDALAGEVSADATEIRVAGDLREWAGSPVTSQKFWEGGVGKHQECIIDDEIIKYESIGPEGEWNTFLGCERGAWGTTAAAHSAGVEARHYGVDGCINGYIIDQETDLMDEVADRIAGIFDYCGFDMVYFDGGEDVDRRRYYYYSTNFQHQAMQRFAKRPVIHMGTVLTHRLWHSFARSGTVDTYLNTLRGAIAGGRTIEQWPTVREHIDRSVRRNVSLEDDMMPAELGWFGIWPAGPNTDGLQLDEFEYLLCKSIALDAPISLQTGITSMEQHPLTPGLLEMFRRYEQLRMARALPAEMTAPLAEIGRDFVMLGARALDGGEVGFAEVTPVAEVGGTHDVRAMVGAIESGSVATLWHFRGARGTLTIDLPPDALRLMGFGGEPVSFEVAAGRPVLPFAEHRTTLLCAGVEPDALRAALESATVAMRPPVTVWLRAADADRIEGEMALGSAVGVEDEGALGGDVLVCTSAPSFADPKPWFAEYTADIPFAGPWTIWARVRYPEGGDASFGILQPGEELTLDYGQVLGNCGQNDAAWHWTGRGSGMAAEPPGLPIRLALDEGPFTFRIYAREGARTEVNPRLDLICISDDSFVVPGDEAAREAVAGD